MDNMIVPLSKNQSVMIQLPAGISNLVDQNRLALGILAVGKIVAEMGGDIVGGVVRSVAHGEVELGVYIQYRNHMHTRFIPILAVLRAAAEGLKQLEHENLPVELSEIGRVAITNIAKEMLRAHINLPEVSDQ